MSRQEWWSHADGHVSEAPHGEGHIGAQKEASVNGEFADWSYLNGQDCDGDCRHFEYACDDTQFWVYPD